MVEIIYLKRGDRTPKEACFLIYCRWGRGGDQLGSGPSGSYIRTGPESIADVIASVRDRFQGNAGKICVRGIVSRSLVEEPLFDKRRRNRRAARVPTIEDLEREEEISSAIASKLKLTCDALARIAAAPPRNASMLAELQVRDYLASAPRDDYAQRRALEKLSKLAPSIETNPREGWEATFRAIWPRLLAMWKDGA